MMEKHTKLQARVAQPGRAPVDTPAGSKPAASVVTDRGSHVQIVAPRTVSRAVSSANRAPADTQAGGRGPSRERGNTRGLNPTPPAASTEPVVSKGGVVVGNALPTTTRLFKPDTSRGYRHEKIGRPECPYIERWVYNFGPFAVRLHHWFSSDDDRALHDHAWWFLTLVLKGGYTDVTESGADRLHVGSVRFRPALHRHTVQVEQGGCWTLLVTGRKSRDWGFWVDGQFKRMRRYFKDHGHHPCD